MSCVLIAWVLPLLLVFWCRQYKAMTCTGRQLVGQAATRHTWTPVSIVLHGFVSPDAYLSPVPFVCLYGSLGCVQGEDREVVGLVLVCGSRCVAWMYRLLEDDLSLPLLMKLDFFVCGMQDQRELFSSYLFIYLCLFGVS